MRSAGARVATASRRESSPPSRRSHERAIDPPTTRQEGTNASSHGRRKAARSLREGVERLARSRLSVPCSQRDLRDVDVRLPVASEKRAAGDSLLDRRAAEGLPVQRPVAGHSRAGTHDVSALEKRRAQPGAERDPDGTVVPQRGARPPFTEEERLGVVHETHVRRREARG